MTSPFPFASGDVLTAAGLNQIGELQTWTPTFNFCSLGNGTYTAEYVQVNDLVFFSFFWTLGSTSTISSGVRIGLPVQGNSAAGYFNSITTALDVDASQRHVGIAFLQDSGNTARPIANRVISASSTVRTSSAYSNSSPFTWDTGDQMWITGTYRKA